MKQRVWIHLLGMGVLTALLLVLLAQGTGPVPEELDRPVTIWIATDLHYIAPELLGDGRYFQEPTAGRDGKMVQYAPEITEAFLEEVLEKRPDVLILSGDLTLNGALVSMTRLAEKLQQVQQAGVQVLTIAGNHDVDGTAGSYAGEEIQLVEATTSQQYQTLFHQFGAAQAVSTDACGTSYLYQLTPGLRILMLDTNCYGKGYVKDETLIWLEKELKRAQQEDVKVISVSHQNLYAHNQLLSFGYQLYNADKVEALFQTYDVRCNFSGHIHVQSILSGVVTEIATGALLVAPMQYGQVIYDGQTLQYSTQATEVQLPDGWAAADGAPEGITFAEYADWYFKEVARQQVREIYAESGRSEAEVALLAETFAQVNAAYFSGGKLDLIRWQEGIDLWRGETANFFLTYIETMLEAVAQENRQIALELW